MKLLLNKKSLKTLSNKDLPMALTPVAAGGAEDVNFTLYAGCNTRPSDPRICGGTGRTK
ncbi:MULTISPECIES: hypothetical protein [unclassified Pseudoalteromonas]|uniref:hypothetical protein n=1 Tax=unclassified Pseudoalteromonas TaxID=194690 RepID=UPI001B3A7044|nr:MULTISPECIES: hypothetical protein [unclassified Pseudoalteromonas]MBQ4844715.1 hypothetical protein [Pseudoalteromonas sp. MMG005]MBQ4851919.1 hypothetical protein [Pseudoalteromonas sp. MMG012]